MSGQATLMTLVNIFGYLVLVCFLEHLIECYHQRLPTKARWYLLHAVVNAIVVALTCRDMLGLLLYAQPDYRSASVHPACLVMALHLYHGLAYHLSHDDRQHHVVMLLTLSIPLFNQGNGDFLGVCNYCLFFLCGLPGGLDYYLMYLVERQRLSKLTEKYYNTALNTWIRAPGIIYGAFVSYQAWLTQRASPLIAVPVAVVLLWNAQYYSSYVAYSYGYHRASSSQSTSD